MQSSFFDLDNRYRDLSKSGDPLERLNAVIDWELFRPVLDLVDEKERKSRAGRKPTDRVLMFKMLVLQNKYNLSDEQLEFQVTDRLSFARFLGVMLAGDIPDARTVWAFRDALKTKDLMGQLMQRFDQALQDLGVQLTSGQIIDATFVPVPVQRNSRESNASIKAGECPKHWEDKPAKLSQKDIDARWTKKGGVSHYGYKNHINIDAATKLITAHRSAEAQAELQDKHCDSQIHERAYKNAPLSEEQTLSNTAKSRIRARVEHVFGYQENSMGGNSLRSIGLARAKVGVALKNLSYNLCRVEVLIRHKVFGFTHLATPEMGLAG